MVAPNVGRNSVVELQDGALVSPPRTGAHDQPVPVAVVGQREDLFARPTPREIRHGDTLRSAGW